MGPYEVFYLYAAELLPTTHRNQGVALGNGSTKAVAVLCPLVIFPVFRWSPALPLFLSAASSFLACALLLFLAPDPGDHLSDVVSQVAPELPPPGSNP